MENLVVKVLENYERGFLKTSKYSADWDMDYQTECLIKMKSLVEKSDNYLLRENHFAHFTASALVVSNDFKRVVLLHHKKLEKWLQPGGHADGDSDLAAVALKEANEETGLKGLELVSVDGEALILDLDIHEIPARKTDPSHFHYDVRFLIKAGSDETLVQNHESNQLKWLNTDEARKLTSERSILRMLDKLESEIISK